MILLHLFLMFQKSASWITKTNVAIISTGFAQNLSWVRMAWYWKVSKRGLYSSNYTLVDKHDGCGAKRDEDRGRKLLEEARTFFSSGVEHRRCGKESREWVKIQRGVTSRRWIKSLNCANPPCHHLKISVGSSSCAYINEETSHKENWKAELES